MLVQNLIANALKFRHADQPPEVSVTVRPVYGEKSIEITVEDNGIGISSEHHERIFDLFARLHTREEFPGTGLGLATCKRIADNHKGSIAIVSELGKGTRFTIVLFEPEQENSSQNKRMAA